MDKLIFHSRAALLRDNNNPYGLPPDAGRILSNFGDIPVIWRGRTYPTVEHAFQAAKYLLASSRPDLESSIRLNGGDPVAAKRMGSRAGMKAVNAVLDVALWNSISDDVMTELITEKAKNPIVRSILQKCRDNGIRLYHFSRSDLRWGCHINPPKGQNRLGTIYMQVW